jgi:hypothetical protein
VQFAAARLSPGSAGAARQTTRSSPVNEAHIRLATIPRTMKNQGIAAAMLPQVVLTPEYDRAGDRRPITDYRTRAWIVDPFAIRHSTSDGRAASNDQAFARWMERTVCSKN